MPPPTSLADPAPLSPLIAAVSWLQGALTGDAARAVAIIAVAFVGAVALAGRLDLRRGVTVVIGCFVLFGAAGIAAGIRAAIDKVDGSRPAQVTPPAPVVAAWPVPPPVPANTDPYAGASVFTSPH